MSERVFAIIAGFKNRNVGRTRPSIGEYHFDDLIKLRIMPKEHLWHWQCWHRRPMYHQWVFTLGWGQEPYSATGAGPGILAADWTGELTYRRTLQMHANANDPSRLSMKLVLLDNWARRVPSATWAYSRISLADLENGYFETDRESSSSNTTQGWLLASYSMTFPSISVCKRTLQTPFTFVHSLSTSWIPSRSLKASQGPRTRAKKGKGTYVWRDFNTLRKSDERSSSLMSLAWYHPLTSTRILPTLASFCITTYHSPFDCLTSNICAREDQDK